MKVPIKVHTNHLIECCVKQCDHKSKCTCNPLSGKLKLDRCFVPELYEENGQFYCRTKDIKSPAKKQFVDALVYFRDGEIIVEGEI